MKKVVLDQDKCIGCGACIAMAPKNFDFEGNLSTLINDEVDENTVSAAEACPVFAISIVDENACNCNEGDECTCGEDCECDDCHIHNSEE